MPARRLRADVLRARRPPELYGRLGLVLTPEVERYAAALDRTPSSTALANSPVGQWRRRTRLRSGAYPLTAATERRLGASPLRGSARQGQVAGGRGRQEGLQLSRGRPGSASSATIGPSSTLRSSARAVARGPPALPRLRSIWADLDHPVRDKRRRTSPAPDLRRPSGLRRPGLGAAPRLRPPVIGGPSSMPRARARQVELTKSYVGAAASSSARAESSVRPQKRGVAPATAAARSASAPRRPVSSGSARRPLVDSPSVRSGPSPGRPCRPASPSSAAAGVSVGMRRDHQRPLEAGAAPCTTSEPRCGDSAGQAPQVGGAAPPLVAPSSAAPETASEQQSRRGWFPVADLAWLGGPSGVAGA